MDGIAYLLLTPFDLILQLIKWVFMVAVVGIVLYGAWYFVSTPFIYLWKAIKKWLGINKGGE